MTIQAIFSDIDGTLLNDEHRMSNQQANIINTSIDEGVAFVLTTARSPQGVYPIMNRYHIHCHMIAFNGALLLDEKGHVLYENGFKKQQALEVCHFIEQQHFNLTYNIFTKDQWLVKDLNDQRVKREESIVEAQAELGDVNDLKDNVMVDKILCMCDPHDILEIENKLKNHFPDLQIAKSSNILIEINNGGVSKATAIQQFCQTMHIDIKNVMAIGDNYNDLTMLESVGHPVVMDNAPLAIKEQFRQHTLSNNDDGVAHILHKMILSNRQ